MSVFSLSPSGTLFSGWREIALTPFPSKELVVLPHQEPRVKMKLLATKKRNYSRSFCLFQEFFVEAIFHPGRFSTLAITKTLEVRNSIGLMGFTYALSFQLYAPSDQEPARELAKEVILRVEHEVHTSMKAPIKAYLRILFIHISCSLQPALWKWTLTSIANTVSTVGPSFMSSVRSTSSWYPSHLLYLKTPGLAWECY